MGIKNTTRAMREDPAEPMAALLEGMATGSASSFIERQERDGQRQLVNSDRLPTDHGVDAPWLALGFTFGDPDPADPMFMPATLPPGWERRATDHSMGSVIVDTLGRERVSIFYKAAFYDRSANMHLIGLSWYVTKSVEYDAGPVIYDEEWATPLAVLSAMTEIHARLCEEAEEFRGYAANENSRDEGNRRSCARIAEEKTAKAALYADAMRALAEQHGIVLDVTDGG